MAGDDDLELSEHAARTRAMWNAEAHDWVAGGRDRWDRREPVWGMWDVPEAEVRILPDARGLDVLDLGCGTGYWSAWLAGSGPAPSASTSPRPSSRPRGRSSASTASSSRSC